MPELDEIKKIVQATQEQVEALRLDVQKIRRRMWLASVYGIVKILIIVLPIVFGIWLFGPQLKSLYQTWEELAESASAVQRGAFTSPDESVQVLLGSPLRDRIEHKVVHISFYYWWRGISGWISYDWLRREAMRDGVHGNSNSRVTKDFGGPLAAGPYLLHLIIDNRDPEAGESICLPGAIPHVVAVRVCEPGEVLRIEEAGLFQSRLHTLGKVTRLVRFQGYLLETN